MDRRNFIKLTAITGTSVALASCGNPEHQLIRFVPDDDIVPGIAEWKPSVCPLCRAGCGLQVRVMAADAEVRRQGETGVMQMNVAKKLEGSAAHPVNRGAICARGQAAIQITYHPDRLTTPLKRSGARGDGAFTPVTWDAALAELVQHLDALAAGGDQKSLAFLTRGGRGHRQALVTQFVKAYGGGAVVTWEIFGDEVLRRANAISFGRDQLPTFDLARARMVLAFGADFLGTWNSPVSQSLAYGEMRQERPGIRGSLTVVEPRMSLTGANADEWVPARPGSEGILALGLAHVILDAKLRPAAAAGRAGSAIDGWSGGLAEYTPQAVEQQTGVAAARIERIAHELAERSPAVAIIGGAPLAQTNGLFNALAVNALNALLGSVGAPGGLVFTPQPAFGAATEAVDVDAPPLPKLASDLLSSGRPPVQLLMLDDANPVFSTPAAWRVRDALAKIPYIVSFGSFIDETSSLADLILPDHSFLESWVDAVPESGSRVPVATVAGPVMRPLHDTRAMPDVLLDVAQKLKQPLKLPWKTFDEMLKAAYATLPAGSGGDAWTAAQTQGGWWDEAASAQGASPDKTAARPARRVEAQFDGDAAQFPFHFLPYASQALYDGSVAHLPWLQELPDPLTSGMWSTWVELNPKTAARLGVATGDLVDVASSHGTVRVPAMVSPGIAPDAVAMPVGQGHETFTRFASGRGQNPIAILAPITESETGALAWAATRVRVARAGEADGRLILFAAEMREQPHAAEKR